MENTPNPAQILALSYFSLLYFLFLLRKNKTVPPIMNMTPTIILIITEVGFTFPARNIEVGQSAPPKIETERALLVKRVIATTTVRSSAHNNLFCSQSFGIIRMSGRESVHQ